ncbi:hypothetical protein L1987_78319 [Smallanthus sonchifolius]|uniref:Uncharacterized protein n=1 Tax=Smallanthus sonchifolius TaxID=185202 RepID=A0ACB8ZBI8_9ASTR|nr:hypothetical protein L1987_78319 [Smallanthus sonchifolius]
MVGNFGVEVDGVSGLKSMVGNFRTSPENGSYGGDECCVDCYTMVEKKSSAWIAHSLTGRSIQDDIVCILMNTTHKLRILKYNDSNQFTDTDV